MTESFKNSSNGLRKQDLHWRTFFRHSFPQLLAFSKSIPPFNPELSTRCWNSNSRAVTPSWHIQFIQFSRIKGSNSSGTLRGHLEVSDCSSPTPTDAFISGGFYDNIHQDSINGCGSVRCVGHLYCGTRNSGKTCNLSPSTKEHGL